MHAAPRRQYRRPSVERMRSGEADGLDVPLLEHPLHVTIGVNLVACGQGLCSVEVNVASGNELRLSQGCQGLGVDLADLSATDKRGPHPVHRLASLGEIRRGHPPQKSQRLRHLIHSVHAILDADPATIAMLGEDAEDGVVIVQALARHSVAKIG